MSFDIVGVAPKERLGTPAVAQTEIGVVNFAVST